MKKYTIGIVLLLTVVVMTMSSCNTKNDPEPPSGGGLEEINIPDGFEFETSGDVHIHLTVEGDGSAKYDRMKFFVYSGNPEDMGVLLTSGGVNNSGVYETYVSLPLIHDSLFVSSNITGISLGMVAIESAAVIHTFTIDPVNIPTSVNRSMASADIISDFENGLDGWTPYRDNSINTSDAGNTPITDGPMGATDKFIWGFDTRGGLRSFQAPAKFSGDLYGNYLAYHYYLGNTVAVRPVANNIADIRITDGNQVLAIDLASTFQHEVNAGWQTIYAKLDETEVSGSGWRIGNMSTWTTGNGSRSTPSTSATNAQVQQILQNVTGILIAPEYQVGYYSSNGPEFICLGKVGVVNDLTTFPVIQQGQTPNDADNDGVPDDTDDYPNDPNKAYNNFSPGEGIYASLAYEDLWPRKGDYDFNDVVIDYSINIITNASNKVVEMDGDFLLKATGAGYLNGFAMELPVAQSTVTAVSGQQFSGGTFSLNANGTEAGQTNAVIAFFDDAHTLFGAEGFINTDPSLDYIEPVELDIQVVFDGSFEISDLGTAPYNPFIVANQERSFEVHLPGYANTALADATLFGTEDDDTQISLSKYYQTTINLPWAIHIPVDFDYPIESASIETAFLRFVAWAESGGDQYPDWYLDVNGYRNTEFIYPLP